MGLEKAKINSKIDGLPVGIARNDEVPAKEPKTIMIPKHRFDVINLALKETKQVLKDKTELVDEIGEQLLKFRNQLIEARVETVLVRFGAKSIIAAKSLLDYSKLSLEDDGNVVGITEQVAKLKSDNNYLFKLNEQTGYMLVPIGSEISKMLLDKSKDALSESEV